ncbi:hypothetical protein F4815DRAFT_441963 [Daldinia loculata]|nr:hypothetical protein F4815DRAFT_441963 [Daldinia loculata]
MAPEITASVTYWTVVEIMFMFMFMFMFMAGQWIGMVPGVSSTERLVTNPNDAHREYREILTSGIREVVSRADVA